MSMKMFKAPNKWVICLLLAGGLAADALPSGAGDFSVLVFSKTLLYRHTSITNGIAAIKKLGAQNHFNVDATEDSSWFTRGQLAKYQAVVFLSTSGDILNREQQSAFREFVEQGGGLAAVHAAVAGDLATEGSWPWYGEALCARFTNHSAVVSATVHPVDRMNASTSILPANWVRTDEWYNFMNNPRGKTRVLAVLDEASYQGGTMGTDHPVAWCHRAGKGRIWYTALGHTEASFSEPLFLSHLLGGIQVAAGAKPAEFATSELPTHPK